MSKEEEKKNVYNQMALILNYQPTIKEQHIYMGGQKNQEPEDYVELVDLVFFTLPEFQSMEGQARLRSVIKSTLPRIDAGSGSDWIVVYIAYHFYLGRELIMKGYADFFKDIDSLLPNVLNKVNKDGKGRDKQYKKYTDMLAYETKKWFIEDECLPPMNEWTSTKYTYKVDDERRRRIQQLVKEIFQDLKK